MWKGTFLLGNVYCMPKVRQIWNGKSVIRSLLIFIVSGDWFKSQMTLCKIGYQWKYSSDPQQNQ